MKIAIIDSGINTKHPLLKDVKFSGIQFYKNKKNVIEESNNIEDNIGHGTAIVGIISKEIKNIEYYLIKVFVNSNMMVEEEVIIHALKYIYEKVECDIVLMSLGALELENPQDMNDLCKKIIKKGTIIVSAFDNCGALSYPACFKEVIGVDVAYNCIKNDEFIIENGSDIVDIYAKGGTQKVCWCGPEYRVVAGTSFAAAHVVVEIVKVLSLDVNNKKDVKKYLERKAMGICCAYTKRGNAPEMEMRNVVLYPFNKEMHALVRFRTKLKCSIKEIYDERVHGCVARGTNDLLGLNDQNPFIVKSIEKICYDNWDTMIIGHLEEMSAMVGKDLLALRLEKCIENGKNAYVFDDLSNYEYYVNKAREKGLIFKSATIKEYMLPTERNGRLWKSTKPILCVIGTSSKQGKFTTQLALKQIFEKRKYKIGLLGTEPTAELFDNSRTYHMGYSANITLSGEKCVLLLNEMIHDLEETNVDLIITGCQSMTVPYEVYNISQTTLNQWNYLQGVNADGYILCVNPQDEIEYIKRTIKFVESLNEGRVLAVTLFPKELKQQWSGFGYQDVLLNEEEYVAKKIELERDLEIPVFLMNRFENERLADIIETYFS